MTITSPAPLYRHRMVQSKYTRATVKQQARQRFLPNTLGQVHTYIGSFQLHSGLVTVKLQQAPSGSEEQID